MSSYQGNIITKSPATPTGPLATGQAPGIWRMDEVAYWIRQGVWPNANIVSDPYFNYVSLLLSTTSLGNANNNLFVDSSGAFNPIARNGNATQGSFTPYGASWSNYFDGSGDYLTVPYNAALNVPGDFTVEAWVYQTSRSSDATVINRSGVSFAQFSSFELIVTSSGTVTFQQGSGTGTSGSQTVITSTTVVPLNTWAHIAGVRSGSTITLYINGVQSATGAAGSNDGNTSSSVFVGARAASSLLFTGYISNARLVKGTAVYTANFTPSTTPLTAISGTSLLTCQSNRFRDASTNNFTVTSTGDVRVTEFSPFAPAYPGIAYNQSDIQYWSGYFDGSGDYLTSTSANTANAMGTGDWTVEGWIYRTSSANDMVIFDTVGVSAAFADYIRVFVNTTGTVSFFKYSTAVTTTTTSISLNAWSHFAVVRQSGTIKIYINGTQANTTYTDTGSNYTCSASRPSLGINGYDNASNPFAGYLSNVRAVKGTAVYTGTFTPPTAPLTAISGTSLLTCQNAAFTDNSTNNFVITQFGNTTVTGNNPFQAGYYSNYFDGSGDYLNTPSSSAFAFGTGDYTIEGWFYVTVLGVFQRIIYFNDDRNNIDITGSNEITFYDGSVRSFGTVTANGWNHFALSKVGGTVSCYLNGVRGYTASETTNTSTRTLYIGAYSSGAQAFTGYLSNIRVLKGTGLYSGATITPPTTPLTAITNTSLLTCQSARFIDTSTNALALTVTGNTSIQSFDPFYTSTIASNGGSMYFDGSGDWLLSPSNPGYALSTGDFIVEAWVYPTVQGGHGSGNNDCIIDFRSGNGGGAYGTLYLNSSGTYVGWYANTTNVILAPGIPNGTWSHIVVSRVSGSTRMFINGVQGGSTYTDGTNYLQGRAAIGQFDDGVGAGWFQGYMSGVRIVKGTGISSNFTPPTAPRTPTAATTLLLNGMNAGAYDATAINNLETVGDADVSTAVSKFGGSSIAFDGTGDRILAAPNEVMNLATGDFTVEGWFYTNSTSGNANAVARSAAGNIATGAELQWSIYRSGSSVFVRPYQSTTDFSINVGTIATGTWYHVAITRSGNTVRGFLNGVLAGTTQTVSGALNNNTAWYGAIIGGLTVASVDEYWNGYIDDLRVTKGYARYTANFTPPTQAFPTF